MTDSSMAIPAIPADLRGKEMAIPAGYLHESKGTAGIAGIETNPNMCGRKNHVCHMRLHALEIESVGSYPRFHRRASVFKHLTCGDRIRKQSPSCEIHKMETGAAAYSRR
jgi:hypothetical protein